MKSEIIKEMARVLFIEAFTTEIENSDLSRDDFNVYGVELTDVVPSQLKEYGIDMDKYIPTDLATKIYEAFERIVGTDNCSKLQEIDPDFAYHLAMESIGHGVGFNDNREAAEFIKDRKISHDIYYESCYENAYNCIVELKETLKSAA